MWVDPETGEVVGENPDNESSAFVWIEDPPEPVDNEWLPEFYAREVARAEHMLAGLEAESKAALATIAQQYKRRASPLLAAIKRLDWLYLKQTEEAVASMIEAQAGKKKSHDCKWGRFGYRAQQPELLIEDGDKVIDYAKTWDPDLLKPQDIANGELKARLKSACVVPGAKLVPRPDKFYFKA